MLGAACSAPKQTVTDVTVLDTGRLLGRANLTNLKKHVEEESKKSVARWPNFSFAEHAEKNAPTWQLTVRLEGLAERAGTTLETATSTNTPPDEPPPPKPGEVDRAAVISMALVRVGPKPKDDPFSDRYDGNALVRKNVPASEAPVELLLEAVRQSVEDIRAAMELEHASDDKLVETLKLEQKERVKRSRALSIIQERKVAKAVPALMEIVRAEEEDQLIVLRAIGALVELHDERAVGALIDAGRRRSTAYLSQILFAVGALGGKEAEAYLLTVSAGHADPEMRKTARQALEELEHKRERAGEKQ